MLEALVEDMPEFVELFLEHSFDLQTFLTTNCLEKIYQQVYHF